MPASKQSGRIGRSKSKTGCDTCKIRRVRCGEEKPRCVRCISTGRQCSYGASSLSKSTVPLNVAARTFACLHTHLTTSFPTWVEPQTGWRERRAFEFYFHQAGPSLSGDLDLYFWRGCVLQTCRQEPAVWDAIISLSALYERPPLLETPPFWLINNPATVRSHSHREALVWYSRSLAVLQQRINQGTANLSVSLISCILFIAIELLQGNRKAALGLYKQGAQLMINADREPWITTLTPIFRRLGTWVLINDGSSRDGWNLNLIAPSECFGSIDEARNVLCGIVAEMKTLNNATKSHWKQAAESRKYEVPFLEAKQQHLKQRLGHWHRRLMSLKSSEISGSNEVVSSIDGATALLLMTYTSVLIEIETSLSTDQTAYDAHEPEFNQILRYAPAAIESTRSSNGKQPPFLFETGVFLPLFITALKCRIPQLRRQALRLMLEEAPPAQGLFMCRPAAHVVAAIVTLEETPRTRIEKASEVEHLLSRPGCIPPSQNRVWDFSLSSDKNRDGHIQVGLDYSLRDVDDEEGRIRFTQRRILFPGINGPLYDS
ncbi:transcriptional regulator family: Fungal Specific TF [Penicillium canariense]|uniref:Transcriptional regulator family: Fungal Specific TF n=1 Tax=Penicillium canariense TaxID=189055 RepID=A0A9W9LNM5_9EURO|nr:transcriptional regulator family: Fungal Specific TF [Penicillium canariense]KAJ5167321.1 transcriptional regulator family: Fungal Specific TF [Penicillium canariense]